MSVRNLFHQPEVHQALASIAMAAIVTFLIAATGETFWPGAIFPFLSIHWLTFLAVLGGISFLWITPLEQKATRRNWLVWIKIGILILPSWVILRMIGIWSWPLGILWAAMLLAFGWTVFWSSDHRRHD